MEHDPFDARPHLVIAGASGPIGRRLVAAARERWRITVLTREVTGDEPEGAVPVAWNPRAARDGDSAHLEGLARVLEGADGLVNLAGASIADGRFDEAHRRRIEESRIDATGTLVEAARRAHRAPATWLQGSAHGMYGDRGDEILDESTEPDRSFFLGQVGAAWEEAAAPAAERSRLVLGRISVVLAPEAQAWRRLVMPIRLFVGGPIGSGQQWWSWIHGEDLTAAMLFLLRTPEVDGTTVEGPYNLTAPEPARQIEITRAAARRLGRPAVAPVPPFALRTLFGEMPDMVLLPSTRAVPRRLLEAGFTFRYPTVDEAVEALLAAEKDGAAA
jgi:hypothetical protein